MSLSWIDILFAFVSIIALYRGYRNGVVVELCGLIGIVIGGYVAYYFSDKVVSLLKMNFPYAKEVAFAMTMIGVLVVVMILARLISRLLSASGLGVINGLLGSVVSFFKVILVLSLIYTAFDAVNKDGAIISKQELKRSSTYYPTLKVSDIFFPYIDFISDYYKEVKQRIESDIDSITETTKNE